MRILETLKTGANCDTINSAHLQPWRQREMMKRKLSDSARFGYLGQLKLWGTKVLHCEIIIIEPRENL